jgi:cellobiose phosphorylase
LKNFKTKYGYFAKNGKEFIITTPKTPKPWINVISNGDYGIVISQTGSGYSWRSHAGLNRITRWNQDLVQDNWGKYFYIRDNESKKIWSAGWQPVKDKPDYYECTHGLGYSVIKSKYHSIESILKVFIPGGEPVEVWQIQLTNKSKKKRKLSIFSYLEWCLGTATDLHREFHKSFIETEFNENLKTIFARKRLWDIPSPNGRLNTNWPYVAFHSCTEEVKSFDTDKESFLGNYNSFSAPYSVCKGMLDRNSGKWYDPIGSLMVDVNLKPGECKNICFLIGAANDQNHANSMINKYNYPDKINEAYDEVVNRWEKTIKTTEIQTPDDSINILLNNWLKYQVISGRLWGRTAYYQMGGGIGFRDQLQDSLIYLTIDPDYAKQQIRLHARHQFKNGTVYHWWHPITEFGFITRMTDDLLWLPFVVNEYIEETADYSVLDEKEPFIDDAENYSIYVHCIRAIEKVLSRFSQRGLPLIGEGDWNDGMSAVGLEMKGESVWLAHFLYKILIDFILICRNKNDNIYATLFEKRAIDLKTAIDIYGWDGEWFVYGTKDSGEVIGSQKNIEGKIHLNVQTWAVISNSVDNDRANKVMDMVEKHLEMKAGPLLLHPAYSIVDEKIGYLTRYAPGVRENGGVYTHAATWAVIAEAILKRSDSAFRMLEKINPINRSKKADEYCAEPYVTAGNIEGPESPFFGKGGWTWYTGSAQWLFRAVFYWILGIRPCLDGLIVDPCIPKDWKTFSVKRIFRGAEYNIEIQNPNKVSFGVKKVIIDGTDKPGCLKENRALLPVFEMGTKHTILVIIG